MNKDSLVLKICNYPFPAYSGSAWLPFFRAIITFPCTCYLWHTRALTHPPTHTQWYL